VSDVDEPTDWDEPIERKPRSKSHVAMGNVMYGLAEIYEGKPPRGPEASQEVDLAGQDDGLKIDFDPDDPTATRVIIERPAR
jgi:hypothetical protein